MLATYTNMQHPDRHHTPRTCCWDDANASLFAAARRSFVADSSRFCSTRRVPYHQHSAQNGHAAVSVLSTVMANNAHCSRTVCSSAFSSSSTCARCCCRHRARPHTHTIFTSTQLYEHNQYATGSQSMTPALTANGTTFSTAGGGGGAAPATGANDPTGSVPVTPALLRPLLPPPLLLPPPSPRPPTPWPAVYDRGGDRCAVVSPSPGCRSPLTACCG